MERFDKEFMQTYIADMSDAELIKEIVDCNSWDADLLHDLIWRAFPGYDQPWEVGDPICYAAAEKLGFDLDSGEETGAEIGKTWYAVLRDQDDNDWGTGSYDYDTAVEMAKAYGEEARIAVIQEGSGPVCIDVISSENF